MTRSVWPIIALITMIHAIAPALAQAQTIIDFEDYGLPPGEVIDFGSGETWTSGGFAFTPGPIPDDNESHVGNAVEFWGYNGTHVGVWHHDMVLTREGGGPFDLVSFDLSGFPTDHEVPFTVTAQPGNVVANFSPDGLVDGAGGVEDFETFALPEGFANITSATWVHTGGDTLIGLFVLDNMVVPEPGTLSLLAIGALGAIGRRTFGH
ncbi:MAG: PEP-CTERM sorting domain-containing protein [Planctomycetes bacterium]|nr:PEP-CTERM sorting domain-containing protein [Planctomycetota bacterium]